MQTVPSPASPHPLERDRRQMKVADWVVRCWGERVLRSAPARGARLLGKTLALAQSVKLPRETAQTILDRVYDRPPGEPFQQAGAVAVSLLALCSSLGISADAAETIEIDRVLSLSVEHFRPRHAEKDAAGVTVTPQEHS